jgi:hypothetical protein
VTESTWGECELQPENVLKTKSYFDFKSLLFGTITGNLPINIKDAPDLHGINVLNIHRCFIPDVEFVHGFGLERMGIISLAMSSSRNGSQHT